MFKLSPDGFIQMAIQLAYYKYAHATKLFWFLVDTGIMGGVTCHTCIIASASPSPAHHPPLIYPPIPQ